jgi:glycosyltransferase involved in cell wall biosynthesis
MDESTTPLVSVICICYNQASFVGEAIRSVVQQTYDNIELLVVDDASTDGSREQIERLLVAYPTVRSILHHSNQGLCSSFNEALALARGEWIIDLAADDVLLPQRIERQMEGALSSPPSVGVLHHYALRVTSQGKPIGVWKGHKKWQGVEGYVLPAVLQATCIATPTMMIRKSVLDVLNGYNEALTTEDFDFWVRSAQVCTYVFQPEVLTLWRDVPGSLSKQRTSAMLGDVWKVLKAVAPNLSSEEELKALATGAAYYERQALILGQPTLAASFATISKKNLLTSILYKCQKVGFPLQLFYSLYIRLLR